MLVVHVDIYQFVCRKKTGITTIQEMLVAEMW